MNTGCKWRVSPFNARMFKVLEEGSLLPDHTLASVYPPQYYRWSRALTAVQQISLHLLLHRPQQHGESLDPVYGPYISTLPQGFASHPLTWAVKRQLNEDNLGVHLLGDLPPSAFSTLESLRARFWEDWKVICSYLIEEPTIIAKSTRSDLTIARIQAADSALMMDYVWAWLNVNTRCIYYPVRQLASDKDNMTLCPILDFANHDEKCSQLMPVLDPKVRAPGSRKSCGDYSFVSCADKSIERDQELFLRYGGHPNRTLFVEYGFVNRSAPEAFTSGEERGEIDVQDVIEQLFSESSLGLLIKETLENEGYWGDWTLHSSPPPAYPSYRLISALRLYHAIEHSPSNTSCIPDKALQAWRDVINGRINSISSENEIGWRKSLISVCEQITRRAEESICSDTLRSSETNHDKPGWHQWSKESIRTLWREESEVARAVARSIRAGEEF
ncbi:hypothetical protein AcW1_005897 [Taiwanofungus camphoratus]|nr:hypothetical protein AcW2_004652 [Antrodia cinnamomea]KAI0950370.1 hypothetical protein AcV7_008858 [Antrodia cinnamomea]KAI0957537.1 hypothetical protein AcW1_005897 [Antrodia cinnamomea]